LPPTDAEKEGKGRLVHSRPIHSGRVVEVAVDRVELPNGRTVDLDMVRHPGAAAIVPFISRTDILMVRQYRWAVGGFIYEIPAGKLDDGKEDPLLCARRELEEEVGHQAGRMEPLGPIVTAPGFTDEVIHLFMATELTPGTQALEADEILRVERVPFTTALDWALTGRIKDAKTLCGLLRADLFRRRPAAQQ
jgi:ADP-ribose pyrophosphatase